MVKLVYYGELRALTGLREETADAGSMYAVLKEIEARHGAAAAKAAKRSTITLDGVGVSKPNGKTPLPEQCELCFFPVCGGG